MTKGCIDPVIASVVEYHSWMTRLQSLPMVALVTTGRTGSDFLQSLLDSHPQIVTFNGHFAIYSEFFERALTFSVVHGRSPDAADEFIGQYIYKLVSSYDVQEAKDALGEKSDESFTINTAEFKAHLVGLMGERPLTSRDFLLAIYGAYNLCLGQEIGNAKIIFHHPHLDYEFLLFLKDFPKTRVVFSSRDPRANFCSLVENFRHYYPTHDNQLHLHISLKMILEDSSLAEELRLDYISIRLEDLPREDVLREFARWLGVDFSDSMLRSTWAGLDWHGDRLSKKSFAATGWSKTRTENGWQQRLGWMEQYILNYIMYPRLVHYGYSVKPIGLVGTFFVAFLILLPFKYERRFFSVGYIWSILRHGNTSARLRLMVSPLFYWRRICLCYRYYSRTLWRVPFNGNWVRVPGMDLQHMTEKTKKNRIDVLGNLLRIFPGSNFLGKGARVFIKNIFPSSLRNARSRAVETHQHLKYQGLGVEDVFRKIYEKNEWGGEKGEFYSGSGSHDPNIVSPYVSEMRIFLASLPSLPTVVDLGSGDFNIGRHFVDMANHYYACDIVPELQAHNRGHFNFPNVDFVCLNIVEDDLPDGDVIFLRQVLQHLSNEHILKVMDKCSKYHFWVVTEHLPADTDFKPNADINAGCGIRVLLNSGIDLMKPPFNINAPVTRVLCEVPEDNGVIRTTLFEWPYSHVDQDTVETL